ncbi:MAG: hypothetical protein WED33_02105 [Bacteroidia bacterium]
MRKTLTLLAIFLILNLCTTELLAQAKGDCEFEIEQSNHFLLTKDMNSQSASFNKDMSIEVDGQDILFQGTQYTRVRSIDILNAFKTDCDGGYIPAIKIFYGLDLSKKQIKLYITKASLASPIQIDRNDYLMDVSPSERDAEAYINRRPNEILYEVDSEGALIDITNNQNLKAEAKTNWINYYKYIKIDRRLVGERDFDFDCRNKGRCDAGSVIFPVNVIHTLVKDNNNAPFLYFNSGIRTETGSLRHCLTISTFPPQSTPPPGGSGIFGSHAANMSQLCPTKCGSIIVNIAGDKCRIKN